MCDEYDDERMRAFWRALAEQRDSEVLTPQENGEHEGLARGPPSDATPPKARPKPTLR